MNLRLQSASNRLEAALGQYLRDSFAMQESSTEEATELSFRGPVVSVDLLRQVDLFEQKIRRARAAIGFARNCSPRTVYINRLPPELLRWIFYCLVASEPCIVDGVGSLPKNPLRISLVCTYWRQIVITSPNLWSHIDISARILQDNRTLSCIQTFLSRAGHTPLYLHIKCETYDNTEGHSKDQVNATLGEFITPLVPRTRELKCSMGVDSPSEQDSQFYQSFMSHFLNKDTTLGKLTTLDITINSYNRTFYIQTAEHPQSSDTLVLEISPHQLEDLLLPVTVLRLSSIVPHWASKAFHGLIELRLLAFGDSPRIHESQLVTILKHSPELRVFEFGTNIEFTDLTLEPVALDSLEMLVTHFMTYSQLGKFLRLLETGPNPLFVSIDSPYMDVELNDNIKRFFSYSNVTRLYTSHFDNFSQSLELVNLSHTIKTLAMTSPGYDSWILDSQSELSTQVCLDALYLMGSFELEIDQLQGVARCPSIRKVIIWGNYQITRGGRPILNKRLLQKELSDLGLDIEILPADVPCSMDPFQP
ncbi:unnamed protein product [Rhizoctonia solani]|uniref:F-box domain-containing protein n=1 Tax=Rhizoctonia solani TaxID=456999 RepID=A0A8H3AXL8_9AGAM|nr:unnamed protein product [Rhizoctonia solani]